MIIKYSNCQTSAKQSGDMTFKIADLKADYKILLQAKEDVIAFLQSKEYLQEQKYMQIIDKLDFTN